MSNQTFPGLRVVVTFHFYVETYRFFDRNHLGRPISNGGHHQIAWRSQMENFQKWPFKWHPTGTATGTVPGVLVHGVSDYSGPRAKAIIYSMSCLIIGHILVYLLSLYVVFTSLGGNII